MDSAVSSSPFLRSVVEAIRVRHYSIRTEKAYVDWIKRFILFHDKCHPAKMGGVEVGIFLTDLAVNRQVSPNTQNQALNALNFLYKVVLEQPLGDVKNLVRAKSPRKLPVILTADEVRMVLRELNGVQWLATCLMYGSGLRLMACLRLRVMNLDFPHRAIHVRNGKGGKDRVVTLSDELIVPLQRHLENRRQMHDKDLADNFGSVYLPHALARKYPDAPTKWAWQYVFPSSRRSVDPRSGVERWHHVDEKTIQRAVKQAVRKVGIHKLASCHTLRFFATHLSA